MAKIGKIQEVAIAELKPYANNAKQHSAEQVQKIADSIKEFGFLNPCLIDKDNNLIAGHGRVEASKVLGLEKVPCLRVEGLTDAQRRAYILADNRLTELGSWDMDIVMSELKELEALDFDIELTGFEIELEEPEPIEAQEDDFDMDAKIESRAKLGDVWKLGAHRLMCGDSTSATDIATLINGEHISLLMTDPPYGINADKMTLGNGKKDFHRGSWDAERPKLSALLNYAEKQCIWGGTISRTNYQFQTIGFVGGRKLTAFLLVSSSLLGLIMAKIADTLRIIGAEKRNCIQR